MNRLPRRAKWSLSLLSLLALPQLAISQTILITEGELLPGLGTYSSLISLDINDSGEWMITGRASASPSTINFALSDSGVVWASGQPAPASTLPGATLRSIRSAELNNTGDRAGSFTLNPSTTPYDAVYFNAALIFEEGSDAAAMAGSSPGSTWGNVWDVSLNDSDQLLVHGGVDDPNIGSSLTFDEVLTRLQLDSSGTVISSAPILLEDDTPPEGVAGLVGSIARGQYRTAMNNAGDVIFTAGLKNAGYNAAATYLWSGGTFAKLAENGTPTSFDPNRNWIDAGYIADINDSGDYVFLGRIGGASPRQVLVKNGALFRSVGDPVPGIASAVFVGSSGLGREWVKIDSAGNVLHQGRFSIQGNPSTTGLFLNDELLLQEGVSTIDGATITLIQADAGIAFSDNGRHLLFRANLSDGRRVVAYLRLEPDRPFCFGDGGVSPGCTDCPCGNNAPSGSPGGCINSHGTSATLLGSGDVSAANGTLRFKVEDATAGSFGILMSADNQLPNMGTCPPGSGIGTFFFDGLRCVGGIALRHGTRATDANGDIGIANSGWGPPNGPLGGIAANGGFVSGQTRHFQCVYRESPAAGCGTGQNTTNGVSVTF